MIESIKEIKTADEVNDAMKEIHEKRFTSIAALLNKPAKSKFTECEGRITNIDQKHLYMNFEAWESIPIKLDDYKNVVEADEPIMKAIDNYIETFIDERKLNRIARKLVKLD